jgi:hypothetical protein
MRILLHAFIPLILLASSFGQRSDDLFLTCFLPSTPAGDTDELVEPLSSAETARFKSAPHGVKRLSKHRLQVSWTGGSRTFTDKAPYYELGSIWWTYCGYSPTLKLHLLAKADAFVFRGILLDDESGALLPGGQIVSFSPDKQYYAAYEQPDGQDGETLKVYTRSGTMLWTGYNGILTSDGKDFVADFANFHWNAQSRPQANVRLADGREFKMTLEKRRVGKWEWTPRLVCRYDQLAGSQRQLRCDQ